MGNLDETLFYLATEIARNYRLKDYALFGSTSLVLNGVLDREPGDIDILTTRRLWGKLLRSHEWHVETPKAGDPPILVNDTMPIIIHAFFDWSDRYVVMDVPRLIRTANVVDTKYGEWRVIPVEEALRHKKAALAYSSKKVDKHIPDIEIIEDWLKENYVS